LDGTAQGTAVGGIMLVMSFRTRYNVVPTNSVPLFAWYLSRPAQKITNTQTPTPIQVPNEDKQRLQKRKKKRLYQSSASPYQFSVEADMDVVPGNHPKSENGPTTPQI
jgi:hypothetical protein